MNSYRYLVRSAARCSQWTSARTLFRPSLHHTIIVCLQQYYCTSKQVGNKRKEVYGTSDIRQLKANASFCECPVTIIHRNGNGLVITPNDDWAANFSIKVFQTARFPQQFVKKEVFTKNSSRDGIECLLPWRQLFLRNGFKPVVFCFCSILYYMLIEYDYLVRKVSAQWAEHFSQQQRNETIHIFFWPVPVPGPSESRCE